MRQFSAPANLVLSCLAALGLLGTLTLPWFAPAVENTTRTDGPVENAAFTVAHVFKGHAGAVDGTDVVGDARMLLVVLAAAVLALSLVAAVPALRAHARDVLRAVSIATPVIVLYLAIDRPGDAGDGMNIHWGLIVAVAASLFMASAAWWGSEIRLKRPAPGAWARQT